MYRISLDWVADQLFEHGYGMKEDSTGDPKDLRSYALPLVEGVVEALNADSEDDIWDIIRRFEIPLHGNWAVESIITQLTEDIRKVANQYGYDKRIQFKTVKPKSHPVKLVYVVMDLDATILKYQTSVLEESEDIEDVVDDNPTIDLLQELEKVKERELPPIRNTSITGH